MSLKSNILCNLCGLSCDLPHEEVENWPKYSHGLLEQSVTGSYDSTPGNGNGALDDVTRYTFSLCEFCLDWLFCQFKILPKVEDYQGPKGYVEIEKFRPAKERVENDDWRRFKDEFFAEFEKRNRARNERLN